jgi:hypothetical protein
MTQFGTDALQSPSSKHYKQIQDEEILEKVFKKMTRKKPFYDKNDPNNYISGLKSSVMQQ